MDKTGAQLKQHRIKAESMKEDNSKILEENEVYRKFFVLNMAYTKALPVKETPAYVEHEMLQVYQDFDLAVKNGNSFIEHGMDAIAQTLIKTIDEHKEESSKTSTAMGMHRDDAV